MIRPAAALALLMAALPLSAESRQEFTKDFSQRRQVGKGGTFYLLRSQFGQAFNFQLSNLEVFFVQGQWQNAIVLPWSCWNYLK